MGYFAETMSQEIEDFIRSVYDRFNAGERMPSADIWHTDSVYVNSSEDPDPGTHRGLDAIAKQMETWVRHILICASIRSKSSSTAIGRSSGPGGPATVKAAVSRSRWRWLRWSQSRTGRSDVSRSTWIAPRRWMS